MEYHDATWRLLGAAPPDLVTAQEDLAAAEKRFCRLLPDAVRQWYRTEGAVQVLSDHSNADVWMAARDFAIEPVIQPGEMLPLLPIGRDARQYCTWAVLLDGSDNPPMHESVADDLRGWRACAATFSDFVYSCVWDFRRVVQQPWFAQARNVRLSANAMRRLQAEHEQELSTQRWPTGNQYRFAGPDYGLLIWAAERETEWFVGADDREALRSALQFLWPVDALGDVFYGRSASDQELIDELRGSFD